MTVSYTHLDVYKRQASRFLIVVVTDERGIASVAAALLKLCAWTTRTNVAIA